MGIIAWLLKRRQVDVYLHVDGELNINQDAIQVASSISKKYEAVSESKKLAEIAPELELIDLPEVEFGDTVDE